MVWYGFKPSWSKFFVDLLGAGRVITQGAKFGKLFFRKKSHAEDRPKNCKHSILVSGWVSMFLLGVGIFYHQSNHQKPKRNFWVGFLVVFPPLRRNSRRNGTVFTERWKSCPKCPVKYPPKGRGAYTAVGGGRLEFLFFLLFRALVLRGDGPFFFFWFLVLRMAFCMVQKWLDP